jgi:hypothetical protein
MGALMKRVKRTWFHEHYCHIVDHDHRWQCRRDPCLLSANASCLVCQCGRELVELRQTDPKVHIFACPMRPNHLGHDSRVLDASPASPTSGGDSVQSSTLDN